MHEETKAYIAEAMTILNTATDALAALQARWEEQEPAKAEPQPKPEPKMLTLVEVRAVLADKSRDGHTEQIRTLLEKYGASKLSEIDPARYRDLLDEGRCLGATIADIEQAMTEKKREGLEDAIAEVFAHHGATCLDDLKEEYYPSFLRDIRRLGNG
jgi:uncharacterized protein YicC (UPF0701 family)